MVSISAREGLGLDQLTDMLVQAQEEILNNVLVRVEVPDDDFSPSLVNWLYENAVVKNKSAKGDGFIFEAVLPQRHLKEMTRRCRGSGCSFTRE